MTNRIVAGSQYPVGATDEWVSDVADIAAGRISSVIGSGKFYDNFRKSIIKFSDADQELINSRGFLKRSARGLITEYLRQTRDDIIIFHSDNTPEARADSGPGLFQAAAIVDWMVKNKMNKDDALSALKIIIENTTDAFIGGYHEIDDSKLAHASIKRATQEVIDRVDWAEARREKSRKQAAVTR